MQALAFWKAVTLDRSNLLDRFFELLRAHHVRFCLIRGQAVNAYVEPVVSLDLDVVIASDRLAEVESLLTSNFTTATFEHFNVSVPGSDVRIQVQLDQRYSAFVDRATIREVLGLKVPVASLEDVLQGKVWAVQDTTRRPSKRQKDLADIARILEQHAHLRSAVPSAILDKLV